jgi:tRNA(Ile)-lysidine synthase
MAGHKKVKELFIDGKIPLVSRRRIPLLFCGETLLWVGGMRRSSTALLAKQTKAVVRAELIDFTL